MRPTAQKSKPQPEEVFTDRQMQFKLQVDSATAYLKKLFTLKTSQGRLLIGIVLVVLIIGLIFGSRSQFSSLLTYLRLNTKKETPVPTKPNAFNYKVGTKTIQGNVTGLDQNKKQISIVGQVDTTVTVTQISFNDQTPIQKVTFDPKTQEDLAKSPLQASDIRVNDIIRVTTSKTVGTSVEAADVVLIEILRGKGK